MKTLKTTLILSCLVLSTNLILAQNKMSAVKIYPPADRMQRAELIGQLEIDHFQELPDGAIYTEIGQREMQMLRNLRYRHEVLIADVAADLREKNREYLRKRGNMSAENARLAFEQTGSTVDAIIPTPSSFEVKSTFGGYYRYHEMISEMQDLVALYGTGPNAIIKMDTLSKRTHENRQIWYVKISDNVSTAQEVSEPDVLYIGVQHAREAIGGSSMIFFMQYLCENYATNPRVKELVDSREIYIIPCMNPDGWEYNYSLDSDGGGGHRKNRRPGGSVDLNRNWGVDWGNCSSPIQGPSSSCGSGSSSTETYYGPSAFSEPETQAIRDFTYTKNFVAMIDQHSFGPYYSLPFGRPSLPANVMDPLDAKYYTFVSAAMGYYNGMRAGNSYEALDYEVAGGVKDWMLKGNIGTGTKGKVYGMTGEGGAGDGTLGTYGKFWPPMGQIINLCKGMAFQNIQLALSAGTYTDVQDVSDIIITSKTGTLPFLSRRVGLDNQPVTVTLIPIENIQADGAPVVINSLPNYNDTVTRYLGYKLPDALTNGQRVKFAYMIQGGGITYYDTIVKIYHTNPALMTIVQDNMDGTFASKWTTTASRSGTNNTTDVWRFTAAGTGRGGGSSKALSESAAGTRYRSSVISTANYNTTFSLAGATTAYLTFWVKHRAENFRDKLQVQVSTNGTTWTAIKGSTTVQEPGTVDESTINGQPALTGVKEDWTLQIFDLQNYLGQANMRLRFQFTSDGSNSFHYAEDEGFSIDDLKIVRSTATLVTLPVHFVSFTAALQPNETVRLDWVAVTDDLHGHFEVEKSSNGSNFVSIGNGPADAPYWMIDPSPYIGNNFYRIKQYDLDGTVTYSQIVNVFYNPSNISVNIYPNPVSDVLTVKINTGAPDRFNVTITDMSGRKIYDEMQAVTTTERELTINMSGKAAQMYIVNVRDGRNRLIATKKINKQ